MSHPMIGVISIAVLLLLLLLRIHVGIALTLIGFVGVWLVSGRFQTAMGILLTVPYNGTANFAFAVLPLFLIAGAFAGAGGLAEEAYQVAQKWLGRFPGGVALATIGANAIFGFANGSSIAACAVFTKFSYPEMKRLGYNSRFALGTIASAGVLAMLIPPSTLMIIYGMVTEVSIGKLFVAGIIPGFLLTLIYIIGISIMIRLNPALAPTVKIEATWKERILGLRKIWGTILLAVIILGGIYAGLFTPTEAGAAGAFAALVIAVAQKRVTWRSLWATLLESAQTVGMVFLVFLGAQTYSRFLAMSLLPQKALDLVLSGGMSPIMVLMMFLIMYLFLGCFIDSISMMVLTLPLTFPFSQAVGWDPIWFGIIVIVVIEMGLLTPPFALNVFTVKAAAGPEVSLGDVYAGSIPFYFMIGACLAILIAFPWLVTFLPSVMH